MEGPQVSGPWLVFRGGNAIGVYRPLIYRGAFLFFLPCGTMAHTVLTLQVMWRHGGRRIEAGTLDRVDRSPCDQQLTHVLKICICDGSPDDTRMRHTHSIVVAMSS